MRADRPRRDGDAIRCRKLIVFVATLERLGIDNESQVVVYDDAGGMYAGRLWWMLRWLGHERVRGAGRRLAQVAAGGTPREGR